MSATPGEAFPPSLASMKAATYLDNAWGVHLAYRWAVSLRCNGNGNEDGACTQTREPLA